MRGFHPARREKDAALAFVLVFSVAFPCLGQQDRPAAFLRPTLVQKLGASLPLDSVFLDMEGREVTLKDLIDRPTVLTLVYYRCPDICSPLLYEVAQVADTCGLKPGEDFRLITISFDPREGPQLSKVAHTELLGRMAAQVPADAWHFLTGTAPNIAAVSEATGFGYVFDPRTENYIHPATVMFVSKDGKICRYLNGITFLPADMKMAILDSSEGRVRNVMQKLERYCFSYDPKGQTYVLRINRIILGVTLGFVAVFGMFLLVRQKRKNHRTGGPA